MVSHNNLEIKTDEEFQKNRDEYEKTTLTQHLEQLNEYLGDSQWLTTEFSYVDILGYELLDWMRMFSPSTFADYPNLVNFLTRFENIPRIKEYFSSDEYKSWPLFSPDAKWGYHK